MTQRPSYILFITDQHRYDNLGCNGHPVLRTPHIDQMAQEGVNFDRFYVASPVCMPNRASLMTCRMPSSHGVRCLGVPLTHDNVTFVELMRAAGYDTALIGKSHLQNMNNRPVHYKMPVYREGYTAPPADLAVAIRSDFHADEYQYEKPDFYEQDDPQVPLPFYGFDHFDPVTRHGVNTGGNHSVHQRKNAPDIYALRSHDIQFDHDYSCPQAVRTKIPEEHYSTSYIADQTVAFLEARKGNPNPFFLMVSFPDPHHPFNPPGKYWDMYKPEDMPIPQAYLDEGWDAPEYVKIMQRQRAENPQLGQASGVSVAVSQREAQEARALTCGMISMIDDAIGRIRQVASDCDLLENTVQIFTSDHGDHLGDHKLLFKGTEQYDNLTHVPFIWADPNGEKGKRSSEIAQTHDIGTTILEHAKIEESHGMQGEIMTVAGGKGRKAAHIQYETQKPHEAFGDRPRAHSVVMGQWRLTIYHGICQNELFDLENDPGEMVNLWDKSDYAEAKAMMIEQLAEMEIAVANHVPVPTTEA